MKTEKLSLEPLFLVLFSVLFFLAALEIAVLAPLVVITAPAFFMVLERRSGLRAALLGILLGTAVVLVSMGAVPAFIYMLAMAILGTALGMLAGRSGSSAGFLLMGITISVAVKIFIMAVFFNATGISLLDMSPDRAAEIAAGVVDTLARGGFAFSPDAAAGYAREIEATMTWRMPSVLILFSTIDTFASHIVCSLALKRLGGGKIASIPRFGHWKFPKNIFVAFLVAVAADAAGKIYPDNTAFQLVAINILELLRWLFLVEGLALTWYYMTALGANKYLKICIVALCGLAWPLSVIMSSVGFVDIWFDLRRHIRRKQK